MEAEVEEASFLRLACGGAGDARPTSRSGRRRLHGGVLLDRQARGLCSSPRPSTVLPPCSSSLVKCVPAPGQRALRHLAELRFKSGDGNTEAWRLVSVFENSIFAVVRMEADIPYVLRGAQVLHPSAVLNGLRHPQTRAYRLRY